jgi:redox-sensitive bicupin YhaK (pirin superfamily)
MPAVTAANPLLLPRLTDPTPTAIRRPVTRVAAAHHTIEGAGFPVWRPFPGGIDAHVADPFFLLDQLGPVEYAPNEAVGAPWHPHRGFETVTYVIDGVVQHHDSNGGGGIIGEGDTQWMTAGAGILHDEVPTEAFLRSGGRTHGVQLWVNLPASLKRTPPRYQAITGDNLTLLTTPDGGALIRLIAGELDGRSGPGVTHTPIAYAHASVSPGAQLEVAWDPAFSAMVFGPGDVVTVAAADMQPTDSPSLEVLLLGGIPIREPIAHYGPFLMNTRQEIVEALEDYQAGRMGVIPASDLVTGQ